eukprot:3635-Chlamydomonas_euryale.AAC.4
MTSKDEGRMCQWSMLTLKFISNGRAIARTHTSYTRCITSNHRRGWRHKQGSREHGIEKHKEEEGREKAGRAGKDSDFENEVTSRPWSSPWAFAP